MLFTGKFSYLSAFLWGIKIGKGSRFYGKTNFYKEAKSKITIGDNCTCRSAKKSNWITFKLFGSSIANVEQVKRTDGPFSLPEGIVFPSGNGFVLLKEIQAEGKKRMDYKSFLAGNDLNELSFNP